MDRLAVQSAIVELATRIHPNLNLNKFRSKYLFLQNKTLTTAQPEHPTTTALEADSKLLQIMGMESMGLKLEGVEMVLTVVAKMACLKMRVAILEMEKMDAPMEIREMKVG